MGIVISLATKREQLLLPIRLFSLLWISAEIFSEWALGDLRDPEKGQSVISGSDVNCVTIPMNGVTLKHKQHSHFPNFLTSQLNSFAKFKTHPSGVDYDTWLHPCKALGHHLPTLWLWLSLTAGYNLTWRSVQQLLYCCKRTSLLSIDAFLKIQVLNFYEQN